MDDFAPVETALAESNLPHPRTSLGWAILLVGLAFGIATLIYPFILPALARPTASTQARTAELPILVSLLLGLCLLVLIQEVQSQTGNTRLVALLGVLVALNAALRFVEVGIPGPGGFTPIFVLIILTGYVYGGSFGFLMGALTILVSGLITGGIGPWLPGQMFTAGWVGLSAPLLRPIIRKFNYEETKQEVLILAAFGLLWGFAYGFIMNLWTWPFLIGPTNQYWTPGASLGEAVRRYLVFYAITSFAWDLIAALGNAILILVFGRPALKALRRFKSRFTFRYIPDPETDAQLGSDS